MGPTTSRPPMVDPDEKLIEQERARQAKSPIIIRPDGWIDDNR